MMERKTELESDLPDVPAAARQGRQGLLGRIAGAGSR
jgi:hypothetical protein